MYESVCVCVCMHTHTYMWKHKAVGRRVAGSLAQFVILIQCLGKHFVISWFPSSPFRLQDLISQNKAEDTEKKDEPSKDNQQQALTDQRYFQVLNSWQTLVFVVNAGFNCSVINYQLVRNTCIWCLYVLILPWLAITYLFG